MNMQLPHTHYTILNVVNSIHFIVILLTVKYLCIPVICVHIVALKILDFSNLYKLESKRTGSLSAPDVNSTGNNQP